MKSERRHELQHNDLDMELGKSVEFFKEYGARMAWIALIIVSLVVLVGVFRSARSKQRAATLAEYQAISAQLNADAVASSTTEDVYRSLASRLEELIDDSSVDYIAAQARVDLGDLHMNRAAVEKKADVRKELQTKATACYNDAIKNDGDNAATVAKARMGLARLAESNRDFDAAKSQYEAILAIGELADYPINDMAKAALGRLKSFPAPARMVLTPEEPATQPAETPAETPNADAPAS